MEKKIKQYKASLLLLIILLPVVIFASFQSQILSPKAKPTEEKPRLIPDSKVIDTTGLTYFGNLYIDKNMKRIKIPNDPNQELFNLSLEENKNTFSSQNAQIQLKKISVRVEKIIGQIDNRYTTPNKVVANRGYHLGGVHIDSKDRIYVFDSGNNRILGFGQYQGPEQNADIIIGQPSLENIAAANGDNTEYLPAASDTLALTNYPYLVSTAESPRATQMATDNDGNLYVLDLNNNRVLKYNDPFGTDQVADEVWGQPNFFARQPSCGQKGHSPSAYTFCTEFTNFYNETNNHIFIAGLDIDKAGNLWVTDTGNNRVLRFPPNSKKADLVLGQKNFQEQNIALDKSSMNEMIKPIAVRVHPDTGEVYVLEGEWGGENKILVFKPPFSNGMSASREIGRGKTQIEEPNVSEKEKEKNWEKDWEREEYFWANLPTGLYWARGFVFDPSKRGDVWVLDGGNQRMVLFDKEGKMIDVIGQRDFMTRGCNERGSGRYQMPDGKIAAMCQADGEIGVDSSGNLYISTVSKSDERHIARFPSLPTRNSEGVSIANGMLLHKGWNKVSGKTFEDPFGMSIYNGIGGNPQQLFVTDNQRVLVWNDFRNLTSPFSEANYILGQENKDTVKPSYRMSYQMVAGGYLWLVDYGGNRIFISKLPVQSSSIDYHPQKILESNKNIFWKDDHQAVIFKPRSLFYDEKNDVLWIGDEKYSRILRVINPLSDNPIVDLVIGQPEKNSSLANAGEGHLKPNRYGIGLPWALNIDNYGNLYVVDSSYEGRIEEKTGNRRVLRFDSQSLIPQNNTIFPLPQASGVFCTDGFETNITIDPNNPKVPIWVTFTLQGKMLLVGDGYDNPLNKRLYLYPKPYEGEQPKPEAYIDFPFGQAAFAYFDPQDEKRLIIQDHTWNRILSLYLE